MPRFGVQLIFDDSWLVDCGYNWSLWTPDHRLARPFVKALAAAATAGTITRYEPDDYRVRPLPRNQQ